VDIVTIAILVLVVWCAGAVLIGIALGAVFRTLSHDDRLDETIVHDDALTRDEARLTDHSPAEPADDVDADVPHAAEIRRQRR
jgi:hypothetical protein